MNAMASVEVETTPWCWESKNNENVNSDCKVISRLQSQNDYRRAGVPLSPVFKGVA